VLFGSKQAPESAKNNCFDSALALDLLQKYLPLKINLRIIKTIKKTYACLFLLEKNVFDPF
jgi:hypothetical protein